MIRINLLHERESEKIQRKRDPLNIGLQVLGAILLLLILHYFMTWRTDRSSARELADARQQWQDLSPKKDAALKSQSLHKTTIAGAERLIRAAENRTLWGEVLQVLMDASSPEVQYSVLNASPSGERKAALTLSGTAAGAEPRQVAEKFRQNLIEAYSEKYENVVVRFRTLEETGATARLEGNDLPCVRFDLDLSLGEEKSAAKEPNS